MSENKSTRRLRFEKVAGNRVNTILKTLDRLEKCANRNNYDYSTEDVQKMEKALKEKTNDVLKAFRNGTKEDNDHEFTFL